jgi:glycosyltransferase involved in cell wall biosynthesis
MSAPVVSVVIPAYNEAQRLPPTLDRVRAFLETWGQPWEIVVVDDGSHDGTAERAAQVPGVIVERTAVNRGKGHAVRTGMLLARGQRRLMTDADLSTPIDDLPRLLARLDEGYGVAIGSRALADSRVEVHQGWFRENLGRVFNLWVRVAALPGLRDTQCGFKLFTAAAAEDAFRRSRLDGFSFDVEALYLARRGGHRIAEVPVTWRNDTATRVTALSGGRAFLDLLRIRWTDWRGGYGPSGGT